ncbi:MAG: cellulase family glycosylhydrolase [Prolixibacteraceae bacterium]|nr:cellulase family glycosylhydrolase [Prolixibacteraceae bacterium]
MKNTRRNFLKQMGALPLLGMFPDELQADAFFTAEKDIDSRNIPNWKGFNLLNKFTHYQQTPFREQDFEIMADWGCNFVRLPLSYWCWSSEEKWFSADEKILKEIDNAVELGKQYGIHVNLNFHRAPGYCINPDRNQPVTTNLFEDEAPLDACAFHWKLFAKRYKGRPNRELSFNLINEAPSIEAGKYDKVARRLIDAIREEDANRMIFVDGKDVGTVPLMTITDVPNIVQSGRGYQPFLLTHLRATWAASWPPIMDYPIEKVTWPLEFDNKTYDKNSLREASVAPWKPWVEAGGKVHIGEMGCHKFTPHNTVVAWLDDLLSVFAEQNWGWSLWNLSGSFGVLDSDRSDVKYEDFRGHKLDRKMLEVVKKYL